MRKLILKLLGVYETIDRLDVMATEQMLNTVAMCKLAGISIEDLEEFKHDRDKLDQQLLLWGMAKSQTLINSDKEEVVKIGLKIREGLNELFSRGKTTS